MNNKLTEATQPLALLMPQPSHSFQGKHVTAELYGVDFEILDDAKLLKDFLVAGIEMSGATLCNYQDMKFEPAGVTSLALLSESHASIHTYPEHGALFVDAFTCGSCDPMQIIAHLVDCLQPSDVNINQFERGKKQSKQPAE